MKTFNAIAPTGLEKFPQGKYKVAGEESDLPGPPMAIMLRSHKLQVNEVKPTVRAIVRCGAGTRAVIPGHTGFKRTSRLLLCCT